MFYNSCSLIYHYIYYNFKTVNVARFIKHDLSIVQIISEFVKLVLIIIKRIKNIF